MAEYADLDVVFDCADPDGVARFWMEALPGHEFPHGPPEGYETWEHWADANNIPEDQRNRARTLVDRGANPANDFLQPSARAEGSQEPGAFGYQGCSRTVR